MSKKNEQSKKRVKTASNLTVDTYTYLFIKRFIMFQNIWEPKLK